MPWDPQALKRYVQEHSVVGYPVSVPLFGLGTIEKQIMPQRGGFIFYKVKARRPLPFPEFAREMGVSPEPLTLDEWMAKFAQGTRTLPAMAYDLRERLEEGGTVSRMDVLFRELMDRGCMDLDQMVFCYTFPAANVFMDKSRMQPGMAVEVFDISGGRQLGWSGLIVKQTTRVVTVELFSPVTPMNTPDAVAEKQLKKEHALGYTWVLGKGLGHFLEDEPSYRMPVYKLSEDGREYLLEAPVDVATIVKLCQSAHPGNKSCWQQALMYHTLPLVRSETLFHPFPEEMDPEEVVVDIGEPEGESEHLEWEE